ncbi:hypothetical protein TRAPUB_5980 [Trametes pubescens]|uniref:Uncharacterized protein n=1 Tax=Trametes pubescens TaxID=154538 RepID=A0A1M2W787_TRAPU|nr:hypothetical protein TRAPUB_5980 [Trametes pubescens]
MAVRRSLHITITRGLVLGEVDGRARTLDLRVSSAKVLGSLLRHSFPSLRSVKLVSRFPREVDEDGHPVPPWLHTIATSHPVPETLTTIVLQRYHTLKDNDCCKEVVGTSEEVVGSEKQLPELLPNLAKLKIRLDQCKNPGKCAAYIWSILPGMHNVLMFEYRTGVFGHWTPYTLPAMQ